MVDCIRQAPKGEGGRGSEGGKEAVQKIEKGRRRDELGQVMGHLGLKIG